jgi:hypothetical protein
MNSDQRHAFVRALNALERCRGRHEGGTDSVQRKFVDVRQTLESAIRDVDAGRPIDRTALVGLSRWVADWIPDIDDPLLGALEEVSDAVTEPLL